MSRLRSLCLVLLAAGCQDPASLPDDVGTDGAGGLLTGDESVEPFDPAMLRVRRARGLSLEIADATAPFEASRVPASLRLNLFADAIFDARLERVGRSGGSVVWRGVVAGDANSRVTLTFRGEHVSGTIRVGPRLFTIEPRAAGPLVVEWDEAAAPPDGASIVPVAPLEAAPPRPTALADVRPSEAADGTPEVDVLVVYTARAREVAGSEAALRTTIDLAVEEANESFRASGVAASIRLVDAVETTYDETGFDFYETLGRLVTPGDGSLDDVPALRDATGADHVVMIVEHAGPYSGLGYQMTSANQALFSSYAYAVVSRAYATGFYTFAHELGHNLGANHDLANSDDGFYPDSHGHQVPAAHYRTMMAYGCTSVDCPRAPLWSNPALTYEGRPTGVVGVADNARTLNATAAITAGFRARVVPPAPTAARIHSPTEGSVLPAGRVTFAWNDVGADAHLLAVSLTPGGVPRSVHPARGTSVAIVSLPQAGETLYVRLWSRHGTTFTSSDHVFTAHRAAPPRAMLALPGRSLPGAWGFFAWDAVEGARAYRLEVGTASEPSRFHTSEGSATFAFVVGLPSDGSPVVARLHTQTPAGWTVETSTHRAWTAPEHAATIVSPASGSSLASRRVAFRWTRTSAESHWLVVQDATGILFAGPSTEDRMVVPGLPTDGRPVWVALYSSGPDGWAATSAAYTSLRR